MRSGNKFDLINCIKKIPSASPTAEPLKVSAAIFEGSVTVNLVKSREIEAFQYMSWMNSKGIT